jgi:signal transduction histidine kinase
MSAIAGELHGYAPPRPLPAFAWRRSATILGSVALAVALIGLLGWLLGESALRSFAGGTAEMKANTAIMGALAATAVLIEASGSARRGARIAALLLGVAVAVISAATLIESLARVDLGIDRLLFDDVARPGAPHPGRMAPSSAVALLLIGVAIVLTAKGRRPLLRQFCALCAAVIALIALLGYASDLPALYGFAADTRMAFPTAALLMALALGILAAQPACGPMAYLSDLSPGARMGVRLLPAVILIPTTLALLRLAGTKTGLVDAATGSWLVYVATIGLFCGVIVLSARSLDAADAQRRREVAEQQRRVHELNATLEQRVQQRTSELEAANHELEAFAYSLAHDLRAPLRAIAGFGATLERRHGAELGDDGRRLLTRIRRASGRMGDLIDAMLVLSEVTRRQLTFELVDLAEIVREVADELRAEDETRNVQLEIREGLYVLGDQQLLRVLMRNLLENSWKFTAHRDDARIIVTRADRGVFAISDNGAGFNMDFADLLFKPFARLHREDEFPGTGIGLTTAERIALRHGGALWGEGAPGSGATFFLKLDALGEALEL